MVQRGEGTRNPWGDSKKTLGILAAALIGEGSLQMKDVPDMLVIRHCTLLRMDSCRFENCNIL